MRIGLLIAISVFLISVANAASVGATLTVVPEIQTQLTITISNPTPKVGEYITIYADYEYTNGTDIQNATVSITLEGKTNQMEYNPGASKYSFAYIFSKHGTYFFYVTAEKQGYEKQEKIISISVSRLKLRSSAPPPGITIILMNETSSHFPVLPGENITIKIDIPNINFQQLIINANQSISYGTINISDCNIPLSKNNISYDCLTIKLSRISPIQYNNANLYFKVSKKWIKDNNINSSTISMLKISNNSTKELDVTLTNEDDNYYFYANFSTFSHFVIYAKKNIEYCGDNICNQNETCETCSKDCGVCGEIITPPQIETSRSRYAMLIAMIVAVAISIFYYIHYQKKISQQKKLINIKVKELKLKKLYQKSKILEKEIKTLKRKLKKKETKELRKKFGKKLKELNKIHEKIENYKNEVAELEHKHKIKPKIKKRKIKKKRK